MTQESQQGVCSSCGVELAIDAPPDWPLGLVYESRAALGLMKKQGICVGFDQDSLLIHHSPKEKEYLRLPIASAQFSQAIPPQLSPAARVLYAANTPVKGASWNADLLRQLVADLCRDIRVARRLFDEAVEYGWAEVADWVSLSSSEKSWRIAHLSASTGDLPRLRSALAALPPTGYAARGALLLPHLAAVRSDLEFWRSEVDRLSTVGADQATELSSITSGRPMVAFEQAVGLLPAERRDRWTVALTQLAAGDGIPAPFDDSLRAWTAASLVSAPGRECLDSRVGDVAAVDNAILDDLIDAGRLTKAAPLASLEEPARSYLLARLDPAQLTLAESVGIGHRHEAARRYFLSRDRALLHGLDSSDPRVAHYQALLEVADGGLPDPTRLDAPTLAKLLLAEDALARLKAGETATLPAQIVDDPSLWPLFSDLAVTGRLMPDVGRGPAHPLNAWIGLQRLLGLLWEAKFTEAVDHGRQLSRAVTDERVQDEVANLTAYALDTLGRSDEALKTLEDALVGLYSENLLVNVSIVASKVDPATGVRHLARLVDEAPTPDLQRAGMNRALDVWSSTDQPFPQVLIPHLERMLSRPASLDDFLHLSRVAVQASPEVVGGLPNPGGPYDGLYRIMRAKARFRTDEGFFLSHLAAEFIAVYRDHGRSEWWDADWKDWVENVEESLFVDFGDAVGSSEFVLEVLDNAPELFTLRERLVMAPQAGAHVAAVLSKRDGWLNEAMWAKCFFRVHDELVAQRGSFEPDLAQFLADNLTLCMGSAAMRMTGLRREAFAGEFNAIVDRLRWDNQNFLSLMMRRNEILLEIESGPLAFLESIVQRMRRLGSTRREELTRGLAEELSDWRREVEKLKRD